MDILSYALSGQAGITWRFYNNMHTLYLIPYVVILEVYRVVGMAKGVKRKEGVSMGDNVSQSLLLSLVRKNTEYKRKYWFQKETIWNEGKAKVGDRNE